MPHRLSPPQGVLRTLYLRSGNHCAFPGCDQPLQSEDGGWAGEIAHIEAAAPGGPRFRQGMTDEERGAYANLLLVCATHHAVIDGNPSAWTVEMLRKLKADQEAHRAGGGVYLSYVQEDRIAADDIAHDLENRGLSVRLDRADIDWGESWADHVRSTVQSTYTFGLIISQDSSRYAGHWEKAAVALDRRGIDVVAVALPPPFIENLAGRPVFNYVGPSSGELLADRIELGAAIDFDSLSGRQFEALVADLLPRYGYQTLSTAGRTAVGDSGYDLRVTHDSHGDEKFLVQVKAYRHSGRISVNDIQSLAAIVRESGARGILVTSGQLTSVAQKLVDRINGSGAQLQVLDSLALRQMLVANPDLAQRHLAASDAYMASQ